MPTLRGFPFPDHLHYLVEHDTWARLDPDGNVTLGLTALGAHISGEFLDFMPKPIGTLIERDRAFAAIEMSKTIRSARAPVTGTIIEINEAVRKEAGLLDKEPFGAAWLVRLQPQDWARDSALLVTGDAISPAVERYMAINLVNEFGMELPPP
ncbi:MAG: glycine cleavage system protein H [Betaproteobacteria bacterium]|nr:glycine cleavage system protein H [Betaproteobacteria bacterium]